MEAQPPIPFFSRLWVRALAGIAILSLLGVVIGVRFIPKHYARKAANVLRSLNNLKNLTLAVHNHSTSYAGQLPRTAQGPASQSWRTQLLQYVDQAAIQREYQADQPWNSGSNSELARLYLDVFDAPAGRHGMNQGQQWAPSDYGMISGPGTVQPRDRAVTLDEIATGDGLSSTLLVGECVGLQLGWAEPRDPHIDREQIGIEILQRPDQKSTFLLSTCSSRVPVGFADGSVRTLNPKIDPKVLKALCTIDGDEPITRDDYID